jgi:hypothetical protein
LSDESLGSLATGGHRVHQPQVEIVQGLEGPAGWAPSTVFALTEAGAARARQLLLAGCGPRARAGRGPEWDDRTGELRWGRQVVLRLRRRGSNQWRILDTFQREEWARWVASTLKTKTGLFLAEALRQAAWMLNHNQEPHRLAFTADTDGRGISWARYGGAQLSANSALTQRQLE